MSDCAAGCFGANLSVFKMDSSVLPDLEPTAANKQWTLGGNLTVKRVNRQNVSFFSICETPFFDRPVVQGAISDPKKLFWNVWDAFCREFGGQNIASVVKKCVFQP